MKTFLTAVTASITLFSCNLMATLDTLSTKAETHLGMFNGLKNERFVFQLANGKELKLMKAAVTSITLAPPGKFTIKPRGKKDLKDMKLKSFEAPNFIYDDERGAEQKISIMNISSIEPGLDFSRGAIDESAAKTDPVEKKTTTQIGPTGEQNELPAPADAPIETLLKKGVVNVVCFVKDGDMASIRQSSSAESTARDSKGKVSIIKLKVTDGDDPISAKYSINSYPQFWVYDKRGRLYKKLAERFTENDIDETIKQAMKKM